MENIQNPAPRPFYIIGHNTNTIEEVQTALDAGANAIEPDVNVYLGHSTELCISHMEGLPDAPSLVDFLKGLHAIAVRDERLSLVIFDCKSAVSTPEHGRTLFTAIREHLSSDTGLNIIFSVSGLDKTSIFDQIAPLFNEREGLMIDESNEVDQVADYFKRVHAKNGCYGNGTSVPGMPLTGPNVRPSIEKAVSMRAASGHFSFIGVWTVNEESLKDEFLRIGVDGIISDDPKELSDCLKKEEFLSIVRLAVRGDNPFRSEDAAYSVTVYTGDRAMAGTDSNITLTLSGKMGDAKKVIDSSYRSRMERGQTDYVTMPSVNLGDLKSVTIQIDKRGFAPEWYIDKIVVESMMYNISKTAFCNQKIDNRSAVSRALE